MVGFSVVMLLRMWWYNLDSSGMVLMGMIRYPRNGTMCKTSYAISNLYWIGVVFSSSKTVAFSVVT